MQSILLLWSLIQIKPQPRLDEWLLAYFVALLWFCSWPDLRIGRILYIIDKYLFAYQPGHNLHTTLLRFTDDVIVSTEDFWQYWFYLTLARHTIRSAIPNSCKNWATLTFQEEFKNGSRLTCQAIQPNWVVKLHLLVGKSSIKDLG